MKIIFLPIENQLLKIIKYIVVRVLVYKIIIIKYVYILEFIIFHDGKYSQVVTLMRNFS